MPQPLISACISCSSISLMIHSAGKYFSEFSLAFKAHMDGLPLVREADVAHTLQVISEGSLHPFWDLGGCMGKVLLVYQCSPGLLLARCQYQDSNASLKTPSHRAYNKILHPTLTDPLIQRSKLLCQSVSKPIFWVLLLASVSKVDATPQVQNAIYPCVSTSPHRRLRYSR